jgi:carboxylate-amine ligase
VILDDGRLRPLREVVRSTVRRLSPVARESGDSDALDAVRRIAEGGGGAARQRAAHARGGVTEMLRTLVEDTADVSLARPRAGRRS